MKSTLAINLSHTIGWLARGLRFSGQLALISMVVTICYDVVMRYAFAKPTMWCLEVNTFLIVFLAVFPAADVLKSDSHLKISFIPDKMTPAMRKIQAIVNSLLGIFLSSVMTYQGLKMAWLAFEYNERMSTPLGTPIFIPYLFIPIGFGALALQFAAEIFKVLTPPQDE